MDSTPSSVYPLATKQGVSIPLEVAMPLEGFFISGIVFERTLDTSALVLLDVMVDSWAMLRAVTVGAPTQAVSYALVPGMQYSLVLPVREAGTVVSVESASGDPMQGVFNIVQRWTQLDNQNFGVSV
jgi:hypothetical protein